MHFPWLSQTADSERSFYQECSKSLTICLQRSNLGRTPTLEVSSIHANSSTGPAPSISFQVQNANCVSIMSAENFSCTFFQWWSLWRRTTTRQCHYFRQNWPHDTLHVTTSPLISTTQNVGQNQAKNLQYNIIWKDDDYTKLRWSKSFLDSLFN